MVRAKLLRTVLIGIGVTGAGTVVALKYEDRHTVNASWTTHHASPEPAQKWDDNWDKYANQLFIVILYNLFFLA